MKHPFNPVIPHVHMEGKKKVEEFVIDPKPCMTCGKLTLGYGMWAAGVTCSRVCEDTYQKGKTSCIPEEASEP